MKIERTLDLGLCLSILTNEKIFNDISEDNLTFNDIKIDVLTEYWLKFQTEKEVIGIVQLKPMFTNCFDLHIHILPEHRKEYTLKAGDALDVWLMENMKGNLIHACIPVFCKSVIAFTESFGFKYSGDLKGAWLKNGKQNDMKIYTRAY